MTIVFPTNTSDIIDEIRSVIGREVTVNVTVSGVACTVCYLDPVTNTSIDSLCSGCGGEYWLNTTSGWIAQAHVSWRDAGRQAQYEGGYIFDGDCAITISTSGNALYNIQNAESVLVDSRDLIVRDFTLKGFPDLNRITVVLIEREG